MTPIMRDNDPDGKIPVSAAIFVTLWRASRHLTANFLNKNPPEKILSRGSRL